MFLESKSIMMYCNYLSISRKVLILIFTIYQLKISKPVIWMALLPPPAPKPYILFYVIGIIIFPLCLVLLDRRIGHARLKMGINASVLVYFRPTGLCACVRLATYNLCIHIKKHYTNVPTFQFEYKIA